MHADELAINMDLARRLIAAQFPEWAALPLHAVPSGGTDNALFRLGDKMVVRLPRIPGAVAQVAKEWTWLPRLAPHLPLEIPLPLARGEPSDEYPFSWSIVNWIDGANATIERLADPRQAAADLAGFVLALQQIDAADGPRPGAHNFGRGVPLADRDAAVRAALAASKDLIEARAAAAVWERALAAPVWQGTPVWIHGDLQSGNLLCHQGRLNAVIDFGGLAVGDPACDLIVAWNLFPPDARNVYRDTLQVDDATWERGRGWALSVGLIALPYYLHTNPFMVAFARHTITETLSG